MAEQIGVFNSMNDETRPRERNRLTPNTGIPRLQELSFLEVAATGVHSGASFEEIRLKLVEHMIGLREANPATGNVATFRLALENPARYVRNTSEALKELMRLGIALRAPVPSSASAAKAYKNTTFALTEDGQRWIEQIRVDVRRAYDNVLTRLWQAHPQFAGYVGALGSNGCVIPLAQWSEAEPPRSRERYIDFLVARVAKAVSSGRIGWAATPDEVRGELVRYLAAISQNASKAKTDPFPRNQDFIRTCEEALVRLAFSRCGLNIDYISQEILRRWTKTLGIANFSYHVPGPTALRYWPTATVTFDGANVTAARRVDAETRNLVLGALADAYERVRRDGPSMSMWVPIYRVRAHVCWRLRIVDAVFDRALLEFLLGERGAQLPFRLNLDPAQYGSVPPTELPLRIEHSGQSKTYYSLSLVPHHDEAPIS